MIPLLERFAHFLGLWCCWRRCVVRHREKHEPVPSWQVFSAKVRGEIEAGIKQAEARQKMAALAAHGSLDDLYDFTDRLREQKADAILIVRRPGQMGTFVQAAVTPPNAEHMVDAMCHLAAELVGKDNPPPQILPGDEWKQG